jgi:large subunit ribosomal protein L34
LTGRQRVRTLERLRLYSAVHLPARRIPVGRHDTSEPDVSKRTFQPNTRRRAKTHGFRLRMRTRAGRAIISNRRSRGRGRLAA